MEFVMQNVNVYTGEVIREAIYDDMDVIKSSIASYTENVKNKMGIILIGEAMEIYEAEYLNYIVDESEKKNGRVNFIFYFKVKLSERQFKWVRN